MSLFVCFFTEHITQSIVKSHLETCQYSAEDMKRFTWVQYAPEETRAFQNKVYNEHVSSHISALYWPKLGCLLIKS